jgi:Ca2+-binding EF-hand superfamily protein
MRDAFKLFDTDKSGFIEQHELGMLLRKLTDSFHVEHPSEEDINEVFRELDVNGDGKISRN